MDTPDRAVFDGIYRRFAPAEVPWHYDEPPEPLVELVTSGEIAPCRAVELGCGLGSQCVALARRGFAVTGLDCSAVAIEQARVRAEQATVAASFAVADMLAPLPALGAPFDFAWDWEVLHHVFPPQREGYVDNLCALLAPAGRYYSVAFSDRDPWLGEQGSYRTTPLGTVLYFSSETELRELFSPRFEILSLRTIEIRGKREPHLANALLAQKRP